MVENDPYLNHGWNIALAGEMVARWLVKGGFQAGVGVWQHRVERG